MESVFLLPTEVICGRGNQALRNLYSGNHQDSVKVRESPERILMRRLIEELGCAMANLRTEL